MKTLTFDTETTGFPINSLPISSIEQPHLIQIAALLTEEDEILEKFETIIQCPVHVPEGAFEVHGISQEKSMKEGMPLTTVLSGFSNLLMNADCLVAHNIKFDLHMMRIAYARARMPDDDCAILEDIKKICTMKTASPILRRKGLRWTLESSYKYFVNPEGFSGAHDAGADAMACFKLLRAMEKADIEPVVL